MSGRGMIGMTSALVAAMLLSAAMPAAAQSLSGPAADGAVGRCLAPPAVGPIFVPSARGSGETLDGNPAPTPERASDVVKTLHGDQLFGTVHGINEDGRLVLRAPQYEGEVRILADELARVHLRNTEKDDGPDRVLLTNDDVVTGTLSAITDEHVVIESAAAGTLRIARPMVTGINFGNVRNTMMHSDFSTGAMDPWKPVRGSWQVRDGALVCSSSGEQAGISAELEQKEPLTVVCDFASLAGRNMHFHIILFADDRDNYYGRNSVFAIVSGHEFYIQYCQNGSTNHVFNGRYSNRNSIEKGVARLAYDPETGEASFWLDEQSYGTWKIPFNVKEGKYVIFQSHQPVQINSVEVLPGIVPPKSDRQEETEENVVVFQNEDKVKVSSLSLKDGQFAAKTSFGEITVPQANLATIRFGSEGRGQPRRRKGDIRLTTNECRMTLQFKQMDAERLVGSSDCYGDVQVARSMIRLLDFNIYKDQ